MNLSELVRKELSIKLEELSKQHNNIDSLLNEFYDERTGVFQAPSLTKKYFSIYSKEERKKLVQPYDTESFLVDYLHEDCNLGDNYLITVKDFDIFFIDVVDRLADYNFYRAIENNDDFNPDDPYNTTVKTILTYWKKSWHNFLM